MNIDHINISAPFNLLEEVKSFYCQLFTIKAGARPNLPMHGYWLYANDKAIIHLCESNAHCRHEKQGHLDHIAFNVENINAIATILNKMNVAFTANKIEKADISQLFFKDPAGIHVEVNCSA
ncbi:MAG: VOC family protein [Colwellia sp.]